MEVVVVAGLVRAPEHEPEAPRLRTNGVDTSSSIVSSISSTSIIINIIISSISISSSSSSSSSSTNGVNTNWAAAKL